MAIILVCRDRACAEILTIWDAKTTNDIFIATRQAGWCTAREGWLCGIHCRGNAPESRVEPLVLPTEGRKPE